jgi:peptidoglycan hydrolase-like protein with peptidoglycan-binding domain
MSKLLKNGSRGDDVTALQQNLAKLGYDVTPDGIFGPNTDAAVRKLQSAFGYTVDGIVGEGTASLIAAQIGYGWNVRAPDAMEKALRAQGKNAEADAMKAARGEKGGGIATGKGDAKAASPAPQKSPPKK